MERGIMKWHDGNRRGRNETVILIGEESKRY